MRSVRICLRYARRWTANGQQTADTGPNSRADTDTERALRQILGMRPRMPPVSPGRPVRSSRLGMDDLRALATELAVLVVAASVIGLLAGLLLGWIAGRAVGRVVDTEPVGPPERVLVRPDPQLYLENEALRDEVAQLQLRVDGLRADVAASRARRPTTAPPALARRTDVGRPTPARQTSSRPEAGSASAGEKNGTAHDDMIDATDLHTNEGTESAEISDTTRTPGKSPELRRGWRKRV